MNERIKELAERAEEYTQEVAESTRLTPTSPQKISSIELKEIYNQKFAELIIQDCIDKIETYRIPVGNSSAGELACEWTYDALKQIRDDIKQQFGVE